MKKGMFLFKCIIVVALIVIVGCIVFDKNDTKILKYEGKSYVYLEYRNDLFLYDYITDKEFEVDEIYPVKIGKWDGIYSEGDLYVEKSQINEAINYYQDDDNYDWYFVYEVDDKEKEKVIAITEDEKKYLYDLDNKKKEVTITFDEIKYFGNIKKVSKDKTVSGIITLANVDNKWYWKSEIMKDDLNEYVIALPSSLNEKMNITK